MPLFPNPPVIISDRVVGSGLASSKHVFQRNDGLLFCVCADVDAASASPKTPPNTVEVWESSNLGQTWNECDPTHNKAAWPGDPPSAGNSGDTPQFWTCQFGQAIDIAFPNASNRTINFARFDMASKSWGATITGGPVTGFFSTPLVSFLKCGAVFATLADGITRKFVYLDTTGTAKWVKYDGVSWGSATTINPTPGDTPVDPELYIRGCSVDSNGIVHVVFYIENFGGSPEGYLQHRAILADDTLGTLTTISGAETVTDIGGPVFPQMYVTASNEIIVPYVKQGSVQADAGVAKYAKATAVANPTFTLEQITATEIGDYGTDQGLMAGMVEALNDRWALWYLETLDGSGFQNHTLYYNRKTGAAWGADTAFYTDIKTVANGGEPYKPNLSALSDGWGMVIERLVPTYSLYRLYYTGYSEGSVAALSRSVADTMIMSDSVAVTRSGNNPHSVNECIPIIDFGGNCTVWRSADEVPPAVSSYTGG